MRLSLFSLALATPSQGSGYVGDRRPDLMKLQDQGSRGMTIREAPDGSVYTGDWYDARRGAHEQRAPAALARGIAADAATVSS